MGGEIRHVCRFEKGERVRILVHRFHVAIVENLNTADDCLDTRRPLSRRHTPGRRIRIPHDHQAGESAGRSGQGEVLRVQGAFQQITADRETGRRPPDTLLLPDVRDVAAQ